MTELHPSDDDDEEDEDDENDDSSNNKTNSATKPKTDSSRDIPWPIVAQRLCRTNNGNHNINNGSPYKRSAAECMKRYSKLTGQRQSEKTVALKGPWTAAEDAKIIQLVTAHGAKRWSQIAAELPGASKSTQPVL